MLYPHFDGTVVIIVDGGEKGEWDWGLGIERLETERVRDWRLEIGDWRLAVGRLWRGCWRLEMVGEDGLELAILVQGLKGVV